MLRQLLESRPQRARTRSAAIISLFVHAAIVGTAVAGTRLVAGPDVPTDVVKDIIYVTPVRPRTPEPPRRSRTPEPPKPDATPVPGPVITAPVVVPTGITPQDPSTIPAGEPTFFPPSTGGEPGGEPGVGEGAPTGEPLWADEVEKAVRPIGRQREPRYPDMLRSQRVEGRVVVAYVVDSLGRVEPGSIKVIESAHPLFEPAVRQAVLGSRFRPAEWRGQTVRQLVQQAFVFTLAK